MKKGLLEWKKKKKDLVWYVCKYDEVGPRGRRRKKILLNEIDGREGLSSFVECPGDVDL